MKGRILPGYLAVLRPNKHKKLHWHGLKVVAVGEVYDNGTAWIDWIDKKNGKHYSFKDVPLDLLWEINALPFEYYPWNTFNI